MRRGLVIIVGIVALSVLSGCRTRGMWQTYTIKCAWCKAPIYTQSYEYLRDEEQKVVYWKNDWENVVVGHASNDNEALAVMKKHAREQAVTMYDGYCFCSLRCLNAYKASKDIKEQRHRQIYGE